MVGERTSDIGDRGVLVRDSSRGCPPKRDWLSAPSVQLGLLLALSHLASLDYCTLLLCLPSIFPLGVESSSRSPLEPSPSRRIDLFQIGSVIIGGAVAQGCQLSTRQLFSQASRLLSTSPHAFFIVASMHDEIP